MPSAVRAAAIDSGRTFEEALSDVAGAAAHDESGAGMAPVELAFAAARAKSFTEEYTMVLQELIDELGTMRAGRISPTETDAAIMLEMAALISANASVDQVRQKKAAYVYNLARAATSEERDHHDEGGSARCTPRVGPRTTAATFPNVGVSAAISSSSPNGVEAVTIIMEHLTTSSDTAAAALGAAGGTTNRDGSASRVAKGLSTSCTEVVGPAGSAGYSGKRKGKGKARATPPGYTTTATRIATASTSAAATASTGAGVDAAEAHKRASRSVEVSPGPAAPLDFARATAALAEIGCVAKYRGVIDDFVDHLKSAETATHVFRQAQINAIMVELGVLICHGTSAGDLAKRKDEWLAEHGVPIVGGTRPYRERRRWGEEDQAGEGSGGGASQEQPGRAGVQVFMEQGLGGGSSDGGRVVKSRARNGGKDAGHTGCHVIQEAAPWRHTRGPYVVLMVPGDEAGSFIAAEFSTMRLIVLLDVKEANSAVYDLLRLCPIHLDGWGPRPFVSVDAIPAPFNDQHLGPFGGAGLIRGDLIMDINGTHVIKPNGTRTWMRGGERVEPWLRVTFLRATGQTSDSTTSMVSSVVQRESVMLRLIARQRQALALEVQGAGQDNDVGAQRQKAEACLVYEDHDKIVSRLIEFLGDRCEDGVYKPTASAKMFQVKMKAFMTSLNTRDHNS